MDEFVAFPSRWRRILLTLVAVGFVVLGLGLVGAFGPAPASRRFSPEIGIIVGWFGIVFFGFCGVIGLKKIFETNEQLRVNAEGVRYVLWSDSIIPWHEITDVTQWAHQRQKVVVLHLRDPARFPGRGMAGLLAGANRKLTGGDVSISLTGTDRSFDDAMAAIVHYRQAT